ncbi:lipase family protein [Nocardia sp. CDC159]|uniref:Lipase family protein n=1 Tax=Nocardia pulmonis TaxID=2951408 RepID=A0A9X2E7U4_9NOCA|nr:MULTISPECIES: lipase family protein [Nocardia]MCM6775206.1 lipase family protein [Nocardia pulmonis]MCM6789676.1 lipase family protein [Nocardia sp. CDC159]
MSIRRLFGLFAAALALAGSVNAISTVTAAAEPPLPVDDPFYAQPESLSGKAMGEVVDSRPVTLQDFPATVPYSAWQVKYVSQNSHGTPWTTMAIVLRPENRVEPPVLMANQAWYDSLNPMCGPSYQLRASSSFRSNTGMSGEAQNIADELARGWTVVVPDYLGPDGEFAAGFVEGRNTLDGIRAAENFAPAGLSRDTPVIMYGYSGGSRGTEFAAELAPTYAPELNIRAAAAGGLPVDMAAAAAHMNGGPFTSIDLLAAFGLARAYPETRLASYFVDPTLERKLSSACYSTFVPEYAFKRVEDYTVGGIWPLGVPEVASVVASLRGGGYGTPAVPLYLASAMYDEFATVADTDRMIADYCARGVDVMYEKYPVAEHISAEFIQFPRALSWFDQRLAGAPTTPTCGAGPDNARIG